MAFESLPNELVVAILQHADRYDLLEISLCNQRLHSLVEPILYSTFAPTQDTSLWHFLHTLTQKPYLCNYVRSIQDYDDWDEVSEFPEADESWRSALRNYLPDGLFGKEFCDSWFYDLFYLEHVLTLHNWNEAAMALLLVMCSPSLEYLSYHRYGSIKGSKPWTRAVLEQAAIIEESGVQKLLPRLWNVCLHQGCEDRHREMYAMEVDNLHLYHMIPSVTHLSGHTISGYGSPSAGSHLVSAGRVNRHTTELCLMGCRITADNLQRLLTDFHNLKSMNYSHWAENHDDPGAMISEGLVNSKHCLQSLDVSREDIFHGTTDVNDVNTVGSLVGFSALKTLDISMEALFGWNITQNTPVFSDGDIQTFLNAIPENLENLTLRDCQDNTNGLLKALFLGNRFPTKLKRLKLVCDGLLTMIQMKYSPHPWEEEAVKHGVEVDHYHTCDEVQ